MKMKFLTFFFIACMGVTSCTSMSVVKDQVNNDNFTIDLQSSMSMTVGEKKTLVLGINYIGQSTENPDITWLTTDKNQEIISINDSHTATLTVTALSSGTAQVTALAGRAQSASCLITVSKSGGSGQTVVTGITLSETSKQVNYDASKTSEQNSFTLSASVVTNDGSTVTPSWTCSNDAATLVGTGSTATFVANRGGNVTITASAGSQSARCDVEIVDVAVPETIKVTVDPVSTSVEIGKTVQINATVKGGTAVSTVWQSDNPCATVDQNGLVTGVSKGDAYVSVTVTDAAGNSDTASAYVVVKEEGGGGSSAYDEEIAKWSKGGHIYFHYLRKQHDYDDWAVWAWQTKPKSLEGTLWGANHKYDTSLKVVGVTPTTYGAMTDAQCGGSGDTTYQDEHGIVIDVDITSETLPGGKTGKTSPLVNWKNYTTKEQVLGFFIVDQSKMTGETNWTSDGTGEIYIEDLYKLLPASQADKTQSYLHVYCVQGNVSNYTTSSGANDPYVNPTVDDKSGDFRSTDDLNLLRKDEYQNGIPTSETFLKDRPGVGYQIFVPSFADSDGDGMGDLRGIIDKLDYLQNDVGAKVLWLTPIQKSNSYHGYDVTDYYRIDSKFGTLEDYQELIYKAHKRGMKVLMDMVINHTSKSNVLFQKSEQARKEMVNGKEINYRDMYIWKYKGDPVRIWNGYVTWQKPDGTYVTDNIDHSSEGWNKAADQSSNFTTANLGGTNEIDKKLEELWYKDGESNYYYFGKFGSGMAELNYNSQTTRDYMTDMCKYWLSFGLDGFRLDATKHIYLLGELSTELTLTSDDMVYDVGYKHYWNEDQQKFVDVDNDYSYDRTLNVLFWKQFAGSIKSAYPNCFLVGENFDGWDARMAPFYASMDSQFDFQTYFNLNQYYASSIGMKIKSTLETYGNHRKSGLINGAFTSNHDIYRLINHAAEHDNDIPRGVNGKNHAEVHGSEAKSGEVNNKTYAINMAKYYAATTIFTPGISWIYYGDELGMSGNLKDLVPDSSGEVYNDHGNNVDRWYRQPMKWGATKGQDCVVDYTFGGIEILWDYYNQNNLQTPTQQKADPNSMLNYVKAACAIKNDPRYPTYGNVTNWGQVASSDQYGAYLELTDGTRTVCVCINATDHADTSFSKLGWTYLGGFGQGASATCVPAHGFIALAK